MRYVLVKPIVIDGNKDAPPLTITELNFREEICAGDLRDVPVGALMNLGSVSVGVLLKLGGRLSGQPAAVMDRLSMADTDGVCAAILGFLTAGQETGITPSP